MNEYIFICMIIIIIILYTLNYSIPKNTNKLVKEKFGSQVANDFDVYVINMVKNKLRLDNFTTSYLNSDLSFKKFIIFPAVVGKELNLVDYVSPKGYQQIIMSEKTNLRMHHYDLTRGAVGCYLSHLGIYKKILESNNKYGLIFEDDSVIATDFYNRLLYGLNIIPQDWDIFLLGVICLKCDINKDYIKIRRFWGTHGYIVKRESAKKILSYLDKPLSKQIDADMSLLIKRGIINVYAINPIIVAQDSQFGSDIQMPVNDSPNSYEEDFSQHSMKYLSSNVVKIN